MSKGLTVLILNAHWNNRGDESAIRAMIDSLCHELPIEKIQMMIVTQNTKWFPFENITLIPTYPASKSRYIDALINVLSWGKLSFTTQGNHFIRAVNRADIVIYAPGGPSIGELYSGKFHIAELSSLFRILVAEVIKKKPLFFYAPSMGPFSGTLMNHIRRSLLKRADAIILREGISADYLKQQLKLEAKVTLDSAFQNDISAGYLAGYDNLSDILSVIENRKTIGLVVNDPGSNPGLGLKDPQIAARINTLCLDVAEYLVKKGYILLLIPQLFDQGEKELNLLKRIAEINPTQTYICPTTVDSYAQQVLISKLYYMVSLRYHPCIYATKANIPCLAISYQHKMDGFYKKAGLTDLNIRIETINLNNITKKLEYLEKNYEDIRQRLIRINPFLKEESKKTTRIMVDDLNSNNLL
jgi:colanic acid/amylovoran biosynthesis protein